MLSEKNPPAAWRTKKVLIINLRSLKNSSDKGRYSRGPVFMLLTNYFPSDDGFTGLLLCLVQCPLLKLNHLHQITGIISKVSSEVQQPLPCLQTLCRPLVNLGFSSGLVRCGTPWDGQRLHRELFICFWKQLLLIADGRCTVGQAVTSHRDEDECHQEQSWDGRECD